LQKPQATSDHLPVRYSSPEAIVDVFFEARYAAYVHRKENVVARLTRELSALDTKLWFVQSVVEGTVVVTNKPKTDIVQQMQRRAAAQPGVDLDRDIVDKLLDLSICSLTKERLDLLRRQRDGKARELLATQETAPATSWEADLQAFLVGWQELQAKRLARDTGVAGSPEK
jgi:DNA topoisomerase-2